MIKVIFCIPRGKPRLYINTSEIKVKSNFPELTTGYDNVVTVVAVVTVDN